MTGDADEAQERKELIKLLWEEHAKRVASGKAPHQEIPPPCRWDELPMPKLRFFAYRALRMSERLRA